VHVDRDGRVFRDPLLRTAVYEAAPFGRRQAAQRAIAAALDDRERDRRVWHLSAATVGTDVADELERSASRRYGPSSRNGGKRRALGGTRNDDEYLARAPAHPSPGCLVTLEPSSLRSFTAGRRAQRSTRPVPDDWLPGAPTTPEPRSPLRIRTA
jgi:hypothetical protein